MLSGSQPNRKALSKVKDASAPKRQIRQGILCKDSGSPNLITPPLYPLPGEPPCPPRSVVVGRDRGFEGGVEKTSMNCKSSEETLRRGPLRGSFGRQHPSVPRDFYKAQPTRASALVPISATVSYYQLIQ